MWRQFMRAHLFWSRWCETCTLRTHLLWFQTESMVVQNQSWELGAASKYQRWDFDLCDNIMFLFSLNYIIRNSSVSWPGAQEWWSLYIHISSFFSCFEAIRLSHANEMNVYDKSLGRSRKRYIHKIQASLESRVLSTWIYEYRQRMCKLSDNNSWMCMCVPVGLLTTK